MYSVKILIVQILKKPRKGLFDIKKDSIESSFLIYLDNLKLRLNQPQLNLI